MLLGIFENGWMLTLADRAIDFEESHRAWFYMLAFLITYQLATLFDDVRRIGAGFALHILHSNLFRGG